MDVPAWLSVRVSRGASFERAPAKWRTACHHKRGRALLTARRSGPECRGTLRVVLADAPTTVLATGTMAKTAAGAHRRVTLTLTKAGRGALAKRGASVTVRVTTKLAGGFAGTRTVTLRRAV